ncbi:hypothetical protein SAMN05421806_116145 [Streptomyces indicus]|uniref:Uncharacterized protein n=1 Tax=Streptomyces indicus TaxID=417292 RepID=A0A1G9GQD1_9ACTN|nr:hypothetical protein SAMN05421806_116145 [Streptomyces indicus]
MRRAERQLAVPAWKLWTTGIALALALAVGAMGAGQSSPQPSLTTESPSGTARSCTAQDAATHSTPHATPPSSCVSG